MFTTFGKHNSNKNEQMKTKLKGFLTLLLALVVQITFAQEKTVSGTVTESSGVLPGVSVLVKGTTRGVETDFDGKYSIRVNTGDVLVFSYLGYQTVERTVGNSNTIDVALEEGGEVLDEIVINALGIATDRKTVASSISKVSAGAITKSGENSIIQGLAGKASGVQIITSSGDAGSSAFIQIRGQSTITRSLQPLIVVDGIPVNNDEIGNTVSGVGQQSRLGDINPEDIANLQILKGASAAALWGSRAGNGVIVITTKRGKGRGSFNINYTSSFSFDRANTVYPLQDKYGKGSNGAFSNSTTGNSWGDRIADRSGEANELDTTSSTYFEANDGTRYYPVTARNSKETFNQKNIDAVFRNALTSRQNISISGADASGSTHFFSLSSTNQEGIIRNNNYNRITTRYNNETKITDKLKLKGTFSFSNIKSDRIQQGSNLSGLLLGLYRTPADFDNTHFIGTKYVNGTPIPNSHRSYRRELGTIARQSPIYNNPLWTTDIQKNPNVVKRYIAGAELNYKVADWLSLLGRVGIDHYTDSRQSIYPINSAAANGSGSATEDFISSHQTNIDFIATSNQDLTEDFNLDLLLGVNINERTFDSRGGDYNNFILDTDKFFYGNAVIANRGTYINQQVTRTSAAYGSAAINYKDTYYLTLTGRIENASTFAANQTFFYPSAEFGYEFSNTEIFEDSFLNNGKLRLTYGQVGQEPAICLFTNKGIPYCFCGRIKNSFKRISWRNSSNNFQHLWTKSSF